MHFHRIKESVYIYDPKNEEAVIRASICTGEKSAGFRNKHTGVFHEVMLIHYQSDQEMFMKTYHLDHIKTIY